MLWLFIIAALIFIIINNLLSKNPRFIHTIHPPYFVATHISHRGGAGERVENTVQAFNNALEAGTDMLELDVHLTKDREVIVVHDSELERAFPRHEFAFIEDFNFDQLPRYKDNLEVTFNPGTIISQPDMALRCIPKLSEIFTAFPNTPINLDIKVDDDFLIDKVSSLIEQHKREEITVWGSFSKVVTDKCFERNPRIPLFFPFKDAVLYILYFHLGLLPFMSCRYTYLELPSLRIMMNRILLGVFPWVSRLPRVLMFILMKIIKQFFFSKSLIQHLKARGIPLYIWVCNDEDHYREAFFELGADAVMTDYPTKLTNYLESHESLRWRRNANPVRGDDGRSIVGDRIDLVRRKPLAPMNSQEKCNFKQKSSQLVRTDEHIKAS